MPVFDADILNFFFFFFFFLPTAEITNRVTGKIGANLPAEEGLSAVRKAQILRKKIKRRPSYCMNLFLKSIKTSFSFSH